MSDALTCPVCYADTEYEVADPEVGFFADLTYCPRCEWDSDERKGEPEAPEEEEE